MAFSPLLFYFLSLLLITPQVKTQQPDQTLDQTEKSGLLDALGSLLDDPSWPEMHPNPCSETPWPGIECEIDESFRFHITKIHIGPDIVNPPCKKNAHLSESLLKLPYLKVLTIFNCFVESQAEIPSTFPVSLEHLALDSNPGLSGSIPSGLGKIQNLKVLSLSQNNLQGNIPNLGGLVNLQQLDLSYNNLSGRIPEELGGLQKLGILDLSWNILQGQIPSSLGQLQNLQKFDSSYNNLTGKIPSQLSNLNRLVLLDLSHNFISGPIPENLSGLVKLQYFILNHNVLNSTIPISISSLKNLIVLSLDNNGLIGTIPKVLGSIRNLNQLNLSNNKLIGQLELPERFVYRLGKRFDVRKNSGLCASNKNISVNLGIPICLDKIGNGDHRICPDEENRGMRSSMNHGKIKSNSVEKKLSARNLYLCVLLLFLLGLFCNI